MRLILMLFELPTIVLISTAIWALTRPHLKIEKAYELN